MSEYLHEKLSLVSSEPGVYLMKDLSGKVIYVGKAGNLKKRVSTYFTRTDTLDLKGRALVQKICDFETIITPTEHEALILESNLIKKYRPKYNVILKDDKRYPCLRFDTTSQYPTLAIVRKIKNDGARYFGPFTSALAVKQTLRLIHKTFKLRKCHSKEVKKRLRPCLNFQMGRCLGPCCLDIDKNIYNEMVDEIILFLKGRTNDLIEKVKDEMYKASQCQDFEKAALLRDKMFSLGKVLEKQIIIATDLKDRDVIGIARAPELSLITLLYIRGGFVLGASNFTFDQALSSESEMVASFLKQYYSKSPFIPEEILLPTEIEDGLLIEEWLKQIKGESVSILFPQRGEKVNLVKMAVQNAENGLKEKIASENAGLDLLDKLQKILNLKTIPKRIECFDNSNISGTEPVSCMVVFENGKPEKSAYRKFKLRTVPMQDDYAYMAEVLRRRYGKGDLSVPFPDLLMVDGGKGQLNIAASVLDELQLSGKFDIIGIAKKDEKKKEVEDKIYKPGRANPINFGREGGLLLFLQRIRDEAHRFTITFHRKRRNKSSLVSILDNISGIGEKRKKALINHFKSIKKIRGATIEELCEVPGMNRKTAETLKNVLFPKAENI